MKKSQGFTLAELLIALAILGVIATFTLPKVLTGANQAQATATAKDVMSMLAGSIQAYRLDQALTPSTVPDSLLPYMNYVKTRADSTGAGDCITGVTGVATYTCVILHNGANFEYLAGNTNSFGGTSASNALLFNVDPDGNRTAYGGYTVVVFYNGRVSTGQYASGQYTSALAVNSTVNGGPITTDPSYIQSWN